MQYLAIFLFALSIGIASSALTTQDIKNFKNALKECKVSTNVDMDLVARAKRGEKIIDRNLDCFMACLLRGVGLMTPQGDFDAEASIDKIPEKYPNRDIFVDAIRTCATRRGSDDCETAHELFECMHENNIPSLFAASNSKS